MSDRAERHHRWLLLAALSLLLVWGTRHFVVQGWLLPLRVVSHSMAPVLVGPHWLLTCHNCGWQFASSADGRRAGDRGYCENCGQAGIDFDSAPARPGDRVWLDRWTFFWRPPRRWEIAAVRLGERLTVKRVVGLPGEAVHIDDGDVFVDGQRVRKSVEQMRRMGVLVHDHRFRPKEHADRAPAWKARATSPWRCTSDGFRLSSAPVPLVDHPDRGPPADAPWLWFENRSTLPPPAVAGLRLPIRDSYAINQSLSRTLNCVPDIWCTANVQVNGVSTLWWQLANGHGIWTLRWNMSDSSVQLRDGDGLIASARTPAARGRLPVLFGACDRQIVFAVAATTCLQIPYKPVLTDADASRPFAIGPLGRGGLELGQLRVWRDVHYLPRIAGPPAGPVQLDADHFLLLGDNSPLSLDARHGARHGIAGRHAIRGRVAAVSRFERLRHPL